MPPLVPFADGETRTLPVEVNGRRIADAGQGSKTYQLASSLSRMTAIGRMVNV
jgi:hypothetical protein